MVRSGPSWAFAHVAAGPLATRHPPGGPVADRYRRTSGHPWPRTAARPDTWFAPARPGPSLTWPPGPLPPAILPAALLPIATAGRAAIHGRALRPGLGLRSRGRRA